MDQTTPNGQMPDFDPDSEHANAYQAFATLGRFLEQDGWYPQQMNDAYVYRMNFQGKNGDLRCYAQIRIEAEQLICYALTPIKVPAEARTAAAEFITRANYGMYIGNFEMDFNDGEVRYKSSVDFQDVPLEPYLIRNTIYPTVQLLDRYLPGLLKVVFGGKTPIEAVQEIES